MIEQLKYFSILIIALLTSSCNDQIQKESQADKQEIEKSVGKEIAPYK